MPIPKNVIKSIKEIIKQLENERNIVQDVLDKKSDSERWCENNEDDYQMAVDNIEEAITLLENIDG